MRILVCVKQVPDSLQVTLDENHSMVRSSAARVMNPADECALGCALGMKAAFGAEVTALTMGPALAENMLRDTLSRGADRAVLLTDAAFAGADTLATARTLHAAVRLEGGFDLILCGRRASDGETGQVGPALASLLAIPAITNATAISLIQGDIAWEITQLREDREVRWQARGPVLVTLCEWSYPLPLPSIQGLRAARNSPVLSYDAKALGLDPSQCGLAGSPTRVIRVVAQPSGLRNCTFVTPAKLAETGVLR